MPMSSAIALEFQDQQVGFYREVKGWAGSAAAERLTVVLKEEVHSEYYKERGEWQPISVWSARGYDSHNIETLTKPDDIKEHPVLGKLYRVMIREDGFCGRVSTTRTDRLSARGSQEGTGSAAAAAEEPVLALCDGKKSESSSESSSSSSSHHKKKKSKKGGKKSKKDKKEKAKKGKKDDKNNNGKRRGAEQARAMPN